MKKEYRIIRSSLRLSSKKMKALRKALSVAKDLEEVAHWLDVNIPKLKYAYGLEDGLGFMSIWENAMSRDAIEIEEMPN